MIFAAEASAGRVHNENFSSLRRIAGGNNRNAQATLGEVREKIVISLSMLLSKSVNHLVIHAENFRNAVTSYELQDIGKTVFLTREAAEAALKEREAEHDR